MRRRWKEEDNEVAAVVETASMAAMSTSEQMVDAKADVLRLYPDSPFLTLKMWAFGLSRVVKSSLCT